MFNLAITAEVGNPRSSFFLFASRDAVLTRSESFENVSARVDIARFRAGGKLSRERVRSGE